MKRYIVILIAVLGLMLVGATAQAQDRYFCPTTGTGDWDVDSNWEGDAGCTDNDFGVPDATDWVVIQSGQTCNIDSAAMADRVDVESTANLNIESGNEFNSLTLDDDGGNGSTIDGTLKLQGEDSLLAFEDNNQTIDGAGKIVGQHDDATISITSGEILTNDTTIEGQLKIIGLGDFVNSGTVHANVAGTLLIACASFDDESGAEWKITTSSSAIMKIDVSSTTLAAMDGDWTIEDDSKLDVDSIGFTTTGSLVWTGGTIDVLAPHFGQVDFGVPPPPP